MNDESQHGLTIPLIYCLVENIVVHSRRRPDEQYRNMALHTAIMWGWRDPCLTVKRREYIAKVACRQAAYDLGYSISLAATRLPAWYASITDSIDLG